MDINKIKKYDAKLEEQKQYASDLLKSVKQFKDNKITITREGKEVEVTEGDLWEEVYRLGAESDAGKKLKEKYPKVFEAFEEQEKMKKELDKVFYKEAGFSFSQITPARLIKFVEAIIDNK